MNSRPATTRRAASLGAIGAASLALCVLAAACSGPSSDPSLPGHPSAGSGPSPSASDGFAGVVDTDPADPPILNPSLHPGQPVPSGYRIEPTGLRPPASWDSTAWLSRVRAVAGSTATPSNSKDGLFTTTAWRWTAPGIDHLSAGATGDGQNRPIKIDCAAEGFDASVPAVAAEITRTLELCAQTGLSGTAAQAAQEWIDAQVGPILKDISVGFKGTAAISAAPAFGGTTYQVAGNYEFQSGYLIQVIVW